MKNRRVFLALALIALLALSACGGNEQVPAPKMGETIDMTMGGYTIQSLPDDYEQDNDGEVINFFKEEKGINIMILGLVGFEDDYSPDEIIDEFLAGITGETADTFRKIEEVPVTVDSYEGTGYYLNGTFYGNLVEGQTFLVPVSDSQILFGFGLGTVVGSTNNWLAEGQVVFNSLIDSIDIIELETTDSGLFSACSIASDTSYGYTEDNPVKLGGGEANAEERAAAYFSALGGPYGETLTYVKVETIESNDANLDVYELDLSGTPLTMYIDIDNYETPMSPDGMICWEEIPVSAP